MTTYSTEYLSRLLDAVAGFQEAFDAWMATQVESDHLSARGLLPTAWTRDGEDEAKVRQLELAVAEAAGAAARAVAITGAYMAVQGIGPVDPIGMGERHIGDARPWIPAYAGMTGKDGFLSYTTRIGHRVTMLGVITLVCIRRCRDDGRPAHGEHFWARRSVNFVNFRA